MTGGERIELSDIQHVEFFKRDLITTDLICCTVETRSATLSYHEEQSGWSELIGELESLDGFRADWFSHVSQPPFAECRFVAFARAAP